MILRHETEVHRLIEPRFNTELDCRAFEKNAPRLYNKLPEIVKTADTLELFKKRLKTYLFAECYDQNTKTINENYVLKISKGGCDEHRVGDGELPRCLQASKVK